MRILEVKLNRLQLAFRLGLLAIVPGLACAQIALVQATSCGPGTFPGMVCTIPSTGSGDLIVVGWTAGSGANTATTISSVTDSAGNTYTEAGSARSIDSSAGSIADIWYARNSASGATSVTITPSASVTSGGAVIWEFSGASTSAPFDQVGVLNSQASSATPSGSPVTTASAVEVIVSLVAVAGNVSGINSGNAFTNDSTLKGNGWAHFITSSTGTYTAQWSQNPAGTYASSTASFKAASTTGSGGGALNACDLNGDGTVNVIDVQLAINMDLGVTPCTANIDGADVCNVVVVQRVINAALGGTCVTGSGSGTTHSVDLSWIASTSPNVAGYNVYRGTVSGGPYTMLNTSLVAGTTYTDSTVQSGQTYYYVATAVDTSGNQSAYSSPPAQAIVPTP